MGIFDFLGKKNVPDELPELVTDEIENKFTDAKVTLKAPPVAAPSFTTVPSITSVPNMTASSLPVKESPKEKPFSSLKRSSTSDNVKYAEEVKKLVIESEDHTKEKSFFEELRKNISSELSDADKLEDWYEHKFLPKDMVSEMRGYWENKTADSVIHTLGGNFKDRIEEKTIKLQSLEKEWQNVYFDLIEKEEEIKDEEAALKELLSEFVEIYKRRKESIGNNDQKKARKKSEK
jgi:dGTP triphosphohydrolase